MTDYAILKSKPDFISWLKVDIFRKSKTAESISWLKEDTVQKFVFFHILILFKRKIRSKEKFRAYLNILRQNFYLMKHLGNYFVNLEPPILLASYLLKILFDKQRLLKTFCIPNTSFDRVQMISMKVIDFLGHFTHFEGLSFDYHAKC